MTQHLGRETKSVYGCGENVVGLVWPPFMKNVLTFFLKRIVLVKTNTPYSPPLFKSKVIGNWFFFLLPYTEKKILTESSYKLKSEVKVKSLRRVWFFATPWTVAYQAPPSIGFSRQEYWNGLPFLCPVESSLPRDQTQASCIGDRHFNLWATREAQYKLRIVLIL